LSSADALHDGTEFDAWLKGMVGKHGQFTVLVILAGIGERSVIPLCSTYFHVVGDEVAWSEIAAIFASSGHNWGGAAFFPTKAVPHGGPVDDRTAKSRLAEVEMKVAQDRMVLNEGHFFDVQGRRIEIEPIVDA
jgi:hypothetical protein